jgi:hypothetical protein
LIGERGVSARGNAGNGTGRLRRGRGERARRTGRLAQKTGKQVQKARRTGERVFERGKFGEMEKLVRATTNYNV